MPMTMVETLASALAKHDWTYMMSDDYSSYSNGVMQAAEIQRLADLVDRKTAREMLGRYVRPGTHTIAWYMSEEEAK